MNPLANRKELPEISQHVQPSKLTNAQRRVWLLESIRANMLCYAAEIECRAMRRCSLQFDGIAPAFAMCDEMLNSVLKDVDEIRATYDENWVANQLGARCPGLELKSSQKLWAYHTTMSEVRHRQHLTSAVG